MAQIYCLTKDSPGLEGGIGPLRIIGDTHSKLPAQLCDWAFVSKEWTVVKMHTRLVVASADTVFPDRILPSTGTIGDPEGSDVLIEDPMLPMSWIVGISVLKESTNGLKWVLIL